MCAHPRRPDGPRPPSPVPRVATRALAPQAIARSVAGAPLPRAAMRSAPLLWIPGDRDDLPIADVTFEAAAVPDAGGKGPSVVFRATVICSAASLKWLWGVQGAVEKILLSQCETMASTFVAYIARRAAEGAGATPVAPPGPVRAGFGGGMQSGRLSSA